MPRSGIGGGLEGLGMLDGAGVVPRLDSGGLVEICVRAEGGMSESVYRSAPIVRSFSADQSVHYFAVVHR
jgi:hypothetical protein